MTVPTTVPAPQDPSRRAFLVAGGAVGGLGLAGAFCPAYAEAPARPAGTTSVRFASSGPAVRGGWYSPNLAPLRAVPFARLPAGSITPAGWVRGQLDLQRNGLNGRLDEISDYLDYADCGWVDPTRAGWEELPYWLRGFSDLGLVTGDGHVQELSKKWIDGILATQRADGWFGPDALRASLDGGPDFWPSMPLLDLLRNHEEATGDERVVPFLTGFFAFMSKQPDAVFGRSWAAARWGDDIDTLIWLHNRTGDENLLDLVRRIHEGSLNYVDNVPTWHNVNVAQGFREPAEYWQLAHDPVYRRGTYRTYDTVMKRYGQFSGGGFAGDENARPGFGDPRQGFETCGIVEMMRSHEILTRITGDTVWADRCEELAINSLPAAFDPRQKGIHYVSSANSIALENVGKAPDFQNGFAMQAFRPGLHIYRCCPHNYGQGWPYYSEEMWLATSDLGLCASMYGASEVTARVGAEGTSVTVRQDTEYPFGETIRFEVTSRTPVSFPLWLRVPAWCSGARLRVNGRAVGKGTPDPGSYVVVERRWSHGDTAELRLPMAVDLHTWRSNADSVSVRRGPIAYSLAIGERYTRFTGVDDSVDDPAWPQYEVHPTTAWNVGLDVTHPRDVAVHEHPGRRGSNPFTPDTVPVSLTARVRDLPGWTADEKNVVRHLQPSPARSTARSRKATLIPMGAARLRITSFPTIAGPGVRAHEWETPSASHCFEGDLVDAVNDGLVPSSSSDTAMPRLTFWDHVGTTEWVQYDYAEPIRTRSSSVYFYDDTGDGQCRVPVSWRVLHRSGTEWIEVPRATAPGVRRDAWNTVDFEVVETTGIRLECTLQPGFSGGILAWRVLQQGTVG
jgi:hypothetical protein